jgi:hypothetical protein
VAEGNDHVLKWLQAGDPKVNRDLGVYIELARGYQRRKKFQRE